MYADNETVLEKDDVVDNFDNYYSCVNKSDTQNEKSRTRIYQTYKIYGFKLNWRVVTSTFCLFMFTEEKVLVKISLKRLSSTNVFVNKSKFHTLKNHVS